MSFLPPFVEPILYVLAFGLGFRGLIAGVEYQGRPVSYVAFIAPALLAVTIMYNAFFENTYSSFVRMYYQKTFDAIMSTPISLEEVIIGEIVWGATKAVIAAGLMLSVLTCMGLVHYPHGLLVVPLAFLGGLAFGALGMVFTGIVKHIDMFNLPTFLLITPMFLFSGTFFPVESLPSWAQPIALALPLTHIVSLARSMTLGSFPDHTAWVALACLATFTAIGIPFALLSMRRRLIR